MLGAWGLQRPGFHPVPFSVHKNLLIHYPPCGLPSSTEWQVLETLAFLAGCVCWASMKSLTAAFLPWSWPVLAMACTTSHLTKAGLFQGF